MKEVFFDAACPVMCSFCGEFGAMGVLCDGQCACDYYATHGFGKQFFPPKRVVCSGCKTVRYHDGVFKACTCVERCIEHCQRTDGWR